jgi:hypothetical protein
MAAASYMDRNTKHTFALLPYFLAELIGLAGRVGFFPFFP